MSFFNFFRKSKQLENLISNDEQHQNAGESIKQIDRALFVDDEAPEEKVQEKRQVNHVNEFMGQNFEWQGYNDGYAYPETDFMDNKIRVIKAEFRFAIDKLLDSKRTELSEVKIHLIKISGISTRLEAQLNEKIKSLEVNVHELDVQKILSIENEGIVSSAVQSYRLGFRKGIEKFQQEKYFASSTGLFNS